MKKASCIISLLNECEREEGKYALSEAVSIFRLQWLLLYSYDVRHKRPAGKCHSPKLGTKELTFSKNS